MYIPNISQLPRGVPEDPIAGPAPRMFWGTAALDGTIEPYLSAALGSQYTRSSAGNTATWRKTANNGASADWEAIPSSTALVTKTELDILDGATLSTAELNILDGVTATTAEINDVADISTQAAIAANGDTLTVTAALHAGKVVQFGKTTGTIVTLPAATGTGHIYRFVIGVTATSNANIIKVANGTDVMDGSINVQQDTDVDGTTKVWRADAGDDTMTFAGAATTGGIVGGYIECVDYKSGFWSCRAFTQSGGGAEATPFSATV